MLFAHAAASDFSATARLQAWGPRLGSPLS